MKKLTNNFYSITRDGNKWSKEKTKIIKKYLNYNIFKPVPRDFVDSIFGSFNYITDECYFKPSKTIMFNFDVKKGVRYSLRGLICISYNKKYYEVDLIGNNSVGNGPASSVKKRHKISTKSGRDMIEYWINQGKKSKFSYFKLKSMEDVIGFYWKCGFRFSFSKRPKCLYNNKKWDYNIKILNYYNKKKSLNSREEKEYSEHLRKYFNRYMEGYYSTSYLSKKLDDSEDYKYQNTLLQKQYNLRWKGYSMYYCF